MKKKEIKVCCEYATQEVDRIIQVLDTCQSEEQAVRVINNLKPKTQPLIVGYIENGYKVTYEDGKLVWKSEIFIIESYRYEI
jgi:hypothetical protein